MIYFDVSIRKNEHRTSKKLQFQSSNAWKVFAEIPSQIDPSTITVFGCGYEEMIFTSITLTVLA